LSDPQLIDVFYRGANNHLWMSYWPDKPGSTWWSPPEDLRGNLMSGPGAASADRVFYRGSNNHLWQYSVGPCTGLSVRNFGATGNGSTDDTAAIQAAIDAVPASGGTVCIPAGVYNLASTLVIGRSHVAMMGVGTSSELRAAPGTYHTLIVIPALQGTALPHGGTPSVDDVRISRMTLNGNHQYNPGGPENYYGIYVRAATNVTISEVYFHDLHLEAFDVGADNQASGHILIRNCHVRAIGRQGIGLLFGSDLRVSETWIEDTPSQQFGPAAANGVDIEVEGLNGFVDGATVEDSLIQRTATATAGDGVGLAPAFGPLRNVVVRHNIIDNHQTGVAVNGSPNNPELVNNVEIAGNWITYQNTATGIGLFAQGAHTVNMHDNVLRDLRPRPFYEWGAQLYELANGVVTKNFLMGASDAVRVDNAIASIAVTNNRYVAPKFLEEYLGPPPPDSTPAPPPRPLGTSGYVTQLGNVAASAPSSTVPTVTFALASGTAITSRRQVEVKASGPAPIARVLFFVDGIPQGFRTAAPYQFHLDPHRYTPGTHTLAAAAVDTTAGLSQMAKVDVKF
jgi:hypothetical protein